MFCINTFTFLLKITPKGRLDSPPHTSLNKCYTHYYNVKIVSTGMNILTLHHCVHTNYYKQIIYHTTNTIGLHNRNSLYRDDNSYYL